MDSIVVASLDMKRVLDELSNWMVVTSGQLQLHATPVHIPTLVSDMVRSRVLSSIVLGCLGCDALLGNCCDHHVLRATGCVQVCLQVATVGVVSTT